MQFPFRILDERAPKFIALHMSVYHKPFKTTLRWIAKNRRGLFVNLNAISDEQYAELGREVGLHTSALADMSRNAIKRDYRRLLQRLEENKWRKPK
ncbi:hypothetical protein [Bacillus velezensis]|uniref:hypothetical protein n=1 Tax=Bacillus velezensis TaxID=492670 RepID=UPI002280F881|nr:hypothetical protein [Bacillus velezensis]MCY7682045.1 hypothetical protein [Bacillus velezensis]